MIGRRKKQVGQRFAWPRQQQEWAFPNYTFDEVEDTAIWCMRNKLSAGRDITYYLSGPMKGYPENNFPFFVSCKAHLMAAGFSILSPHEINHGPRTALSREEYLRGDLIEMLSYCQGIILIDGWLKSWGATFELNVAAKLGYDILLYNHKTNQVYDGEELRQYVH